MNSVGASVTVQTTAGGPARGMSPLDVLDRSDPGDDTQRRFRYQASQAALFALAIIDPDSEVREVYCEHHEDVLLLRDDGLFVGVQIKTRDIGLGPYKAKDEEIVRSLRRFIEHEQAFPGYFAHYMIVVTTGFWRELPNGSNLHYLLQCCASADGTQLDPIPKVVTAYVGHLCKQSKPRKQAKTGTVGQTKTPDAGVAVTVLKKVRLMVGPGLPDAENRLINRLGELPAFGDRTHADLKRTARLLTDAMLRAASLAHEGSWREYLLVNADGQRAQDAAAIGGKRIAEEGLRAILDSTDAREPLLAAWKHIPLTDLPTGIRVTELKMAAGSISVGSIDLAKDHKVSAELMFQQWQYKYGVDRANELYDHVRTVVRTECQEAFDAVGAGEGILGQRMLVEVRARLRARHQADPAAFYGCSYEHLMGMAAILTEDCTIWWTSPFDLSKDMAA